MPSDDALLELCLVQCGTCLHACLELAGRLRARLPDCEGSACALRLLDCAQACELAIGFIGRGAALQEEVCAICGEVCEACADCLELKLTGDADHCAETCRECADACFDVWRAAAGVASVPTEGFDPDEKARAPFTEAHAS